MCALLCLLPGGTRRLANISARKSTHIQSHVSAAVVYKHWVLKAENNECNQGAMKPACEADWNLFACGQLGVSVSGHAADWSSLSSGLAGSISNRRRILLVRCTLYKTRRTQMVVAA